MYRNPKYLYGDDYNLMVPSHLNFGKFMLSHLRRKGNAIAMKNMVDGKEISYKHVAQFAISLSFKLASLGVKKGNAVIFGAGNCLEYMPAAFGIIMAGASYTGLNANPGRAHLLHVLDVTEAKHIVCTKEFWENNKAFLKEISKIKAIIITDSNEESDNIPIEERIHTFEVADVNIDDFEPIAVNGVEDVAVVLFSSGTTGLPKGVQLTHLNCITSSDPDLFRDDSLQIVHLMGYFEHNYSFFITVKFWVLGRKILLHSDMLHSFNNVDEWKVDIIFVTPSILNKLAKSEEFGKNKMDNLKIIYSRSSILHSDIAEKIKEKVPNLKMLAVGLGMTECGEPTSWLWSSKGTKPESTGTVAPGIIIKVVDLNTDTPLGPNEKGEIRVKGPQLMKGYKGVDPASYLDGEGFYKTGDLGYYDEDGFVYIVDRIKDIINYIGLKLSSQFIENVLIKHPAILEVAVVGKPDVESIELPMAFVVKKPGCELTQEEIDEFIKPEVADYELLRGGVQFLNELPRNARGKILKRTLKEMIE